VKWADALRRFDGYLSVIGRSDKTRAKYRYYLLRFMADTMTDLGDATEDSIVDYVAGMPRNGSGRADTLRALRSFYTWAEDRGLSSNPAKRLKVPRKRYGPAPALDPDELTRLVIAAAWRDPRRAWAILFVYGTGCRLGSACEVRPEDVRGSTVHFRVTKGDRPYSVPLGHVAKVAAQELASNAYVVRTLKTDTLLGCVPGTFWMWVNRAAKDAGLRAWPHLLRHTTATRMVEEGVAFDVVAGLLGHADLSMLPRYVHTSDERKRAAVEAL
jgi:integrase/recombinase XerD